MKKIWLFVDAEPDKKLTGQQRQRQRERVSLWSNKLRGSVSEQDPKMLSRKISSLGRLMSGL